MNLSIAYVQPELKTSAYYKVGAGKDKVEGPGKPAPKGEVFVYIVGKDEDDFHYQFISGSSGDKIGSVIKKPIGDWVTVATDFKLSLDTKYSRASAVLSTVCYRGISASI